MIESWKAVPNFEKYSASTKGRVKRIRLLTHYWNDRRGYFYVSLQQNGRRKNFMLHSLIAETFLGKPLNKEVNHKDGNPKNNELDNLEWVTHSENQKHSYRLGLHAKPCGHMKFGEEQIKLVRKLRARGTLHREIAKEIGMGISTVTHILLGSRRSEVQT